MADVSHELGSLRLIVDSPLSSKVAMFNNQATQHQQSQLLNPFSGIDGRSSPKPTFSKDQYGKPLAGSLTEMRGQKANIHVMKEMLELCQIIDSEGYIVNDEPNMRVIPFGELFNIYNYISDKVVGILLRARKYKLVDFEGEMLFQRRDDDVPVFLLKPILEIRHELDAKIEDIKRACSPAPQATSVLLDRSAHMEKLHQSGLSVPGSKRNSKSKSRSPSPAGNLRSIASAPNIVADPGKPLTAESAPLSPPESSVPETTPSGQQPASEPLASTPSSTVADNSSQSAAPSEAIGAQPAEPLAAQSAVEAESVVVQAPTDLPTIVVEASAVYVRDVAAAAESAAAAPSEAPPVGADEDPQSGEAKVTFY